MNQAVLVLRPEPKASETAERLRELGTEPVTDPMFIVEPLDWTPLPASDFDALMITSANAVKHAGSALADYRNLPLLAVGHASAEAARRHGFDVVKIGQGGVEALLAELPAEEYRRILHLTGRHHMDVETEMRQINCLPTYHARALKLGKAAQAALEKGCVVLLYSQRAAKKLAEEVERLGLNRNFSRIAALSPEIANQAGTGWRSVDYAQQTSEDALLSLTARLCSSK